MDSESLPITFLNMQIMFSSSNGAHLEDSSMQVDSEAPEETSPRDNITYLYR